MALRKPGPGNSMAEKRPDLAREFHPTHHLNNGYDPTTIYSGPNAHLAWFCFDCGNTYVAWGNNRNKYNTGCPSCTNKAVHIDGRNSINSNSRMGAEFHPTLNFDSNPTTAIVCRHVDKFWYTCLYCGHLHFASGQNKHDSHLTCENCGNRNETTAGVIHSDGRNAVSSDDRLRFEWHPTATQNLISEDDASLRDTQNDRLWICIECYHVWSKTADFRKEGGRQRNCPSCGRGSASHVHTDGRDSLQEESPFSHLSFHPTLNRGYTPDLVKATHKVVGSGRGVKGGSFEPYWCCPVCLDVKQRRVGEYAKRNCTSCKGVDLRGRTKKVTPHVDGRNTVFIHRQDVIHQLHPILNQEMSVLSKLTLGSNKAFWYLCHYCLNPWHTTIASRCVHNTECPVCTPRGAKPDEPGFYYVFAVSGVLGFLHFKAGISNDWRRRRGELISSHNGIYEEEFEYTLVSLAYFEQLRTAAVLEQLMKQNAQRDGWHLDSQQFRGIDGSSERFERDPLHYARNIDPFVRTLIDGIWTYQYLLSELEREHEDEINSGES